MKNCIKAFLNPLLIYYLQEKSVLKNNMTEMTFTFILEPDEDSGFVARCLELKGIYGQGETEGEVVKDIQQALDLALETYSIEKLPFHITKSFK